MISVEAFLRGVQAIVDSRPTYRIGGSGKDGTCDCIGLIIGALRHAGYRWTGDHSSNWAPRRATIGLRDVRSAADLSIADWVYKYHLPGEPNYKLPARFQGGGDLRDYYHAGVVVSVSPLRVVHCTSWAGGSGVMTDTRLGKWRAAGQGRMITMKPATEVTLLEGDKPMAKHMTVTAESGSTVNLRKTPRSKIVVERVPIGQQVELREQQGEWASVVTQSGKSGWMKTEFLRAPESADPAGPPGMVTLLLPQSAAQALFDALKGVV